MDYKQSAEYFIKYMYPSSCIFIGAGLSKSAGLPDWSELVQPLAKELGIGINDLPLPRILQYSCGTNKSQYSLLINKLKIAIDNAKPLASHRLISRLNFKRIWTTNYDDLIEKAFNLEFLPLEVISTDFDLMNSGYSKHQLIKMHGSLSVHMNSDDIVLLESQYETYEKRREQIYRLLQNDISSSCFLFLGVSFNDDNMRKIWATIWSAHLSGRPSFLFTVPPKDTNQIRLFNLWKNDISRYGIEVINLETYDEITLFLQHILIEIYGKTIVILGKYKDDTYKDLCYKIGVEINRRDYSIHSGGGPNIAYHIVDGYYSNKSNTNYELDMNKVIFFFRNNGGKKHPQRGKIIYCGETYTDMRKQLISAEKICILLGEDSTGRKGIKEEILFAHEKGAKILALPLTGENAFEEWKSSLSNWKKILPDSLFKKYLSLNNNNVSNEEIVNSLFDIIDYQFYHILGGNNNGRNN